MIGQMLPELPDDKIADYDALIQIVFRDVEDYISIRNDAHYKQVVLPDHANFADHTKTTMVTGWFERHIVGGQAIEAWSQAAPDGVNGH